VSVSRSCGGCVGKEIDDCLVQGECITLVRTLCVCWNLELGTWNLESEIEVNELNFLVSKICPRAKPKTLKAKGKELAGSVAPTPSINSWMMGLYSYQELIPVPYLLFFSSPIKLNDANHNFSPESLASGFTGFMNEVLSFKGRTRSPQLPRSCRNYASCHKRDG
jgi:hypothetical protein